MVVELSNGLLRRADRRDAVLVDLAQGGAALVLAADPRLRVKRRYRVSIDDHAGIIEVRHITPVDDGWVRIGVAFRSLGLELQELVADTLENAQFQTSRFTDDFDALALTIGDLSGSEDTA